MGLDLEGDQGSEPACVPGAWDGELWAVMLDTRATFNHLITTYAPSEAQAQAILQNNFFRNIADALSGCRACRSAALVARGLWRARCRRLSAALGRAAGPAAL